MARRSALLLSFALGATACCFKRERPAELCAPPTVRQGDFVRIDRTAELKRSAQLAERLTGLGLEAAFAAAYEFDIIRNKPVLYVAAGQGEPGREALLEEALGAFQGTRRAEQQAGERTADGVRFLCTEFNRGQGMVSMSVACAWSEDAFSGYAVRLAGASLPMDFDGIADAQRQLRARASKHGQRCPDSPQLAERLSRPRDRDQVVRDILAAIKAYDCRTLAGFYPSGAEALFREHIGPELLDTTKDPVERVCFVLGTLDYPNVDDARIKAVSESPERVLLRISSAWGLRSPELALVKEDGSWRIDSAWALKRVQDLRARQLVQWPAMDFQAGRPERLDDPRVNPAFSRGMASPDTPAGRVYMDVSARGKERCLSVRSWSGELFLVRMGEDGTTFTRGERLPERCPEQPLQPDW